MATDKKTDERRRELIDRISYIKAAIRRGVASTYERERLRRLERELFDLDYQANRDSMFNTR